MPGLGASQVNNRRAGLLGALSSVNPMDTKYNGWTNYETWCVNLWLTNDEESYRLWADESRRHMAEAPDSRRVKEWSYSNREAARCALAEHLQETIEAEAGLSFATLYTDLLQAALAEVNWQEIAGSWLDDFCPEPPSEEPEAQAPIAPTAEPLFPLGRVVATPGALDAIPADSITSAIYRHERGDWGLVCEQDRAENEFSLKEGLRLMSVYETTSGIRFWIITEADRCATTVLLPDEY